MKSSRAMAHERNPIGRFSLHTTASCALSIKRLRQDAQRLLTFPSPPLKFRTASFPQYGFKQGITQKGPSAYPRLTSPTPLKEYPRLFRSVSSFSAIRAPSPL